MIVKITLKERKQKKENEIHNYEKKNLTIFYLYYLILLYMLNHNKINDINKICK